MSSAKNADSVAFSPSGKTFFAESAHARSSNPRTLTLEPSNPLLLALPVAIPGTCQCTRSVVTSKPVPAIAHPAATVVLLREGQSGCEALLVRRNAQLSFHGGAWVFPGGRIDPEDYAAAGDPHDIIAAGRHAAVREAREEASIKIAQADLRLFSRWVTPEQAPKRFDTLFFVARAGSERVRVDGSEIHEHRWLRPEEALALRQPG